MRQIVAAHDATTPREGMKEFDLANPPVPPYRYQEYPRAVYHHETGATKNVHSEDEMHDHIGAGWSTESMPAADPTLDGVVLSPEDQAAAADLDAKITKRNRR